VLQSFPWSGYSISFSPILTVPGVIEGNPSLNP